MLPNIPNVQRCPHHREWWARNVTSAEVEKCCVWCYHMPSDRRRSVWQSEPAVLLLFDPLYVCVWDWSENILETHFSLPPHPIPQRPLFFLLDPVDLKTYCAQTLRLVIKVKRWSLCLSSSLKTKKGKLISNSLKPRVVRWEAEFWSLTKYKFKTQLPRLFPRSSWIRIFCFSKVSFLIWKKNEANAT